MQQKTPSGETLSPRPTMTTGFVLSHEQFPVPNLLTYGVTAHQAGFDAVWASDHFHPWQDNQGHSGMAWLTLAALGQRTSGLTMGTAVTCPTYRYRPAIVAEAFATLGLLHPGRIFLGVGTGEALNERPAGGGWGDYHERAARLAEAVQVIRALWSGGLVNHDGTYYQVTGARLYDTPPDPVPIYVAAGGRHSMHLAGEIGDGLITSAADAIDVTLRRAFENGARSAGKDPSTMPILAEHMVIVGDEDAAREAARLWQFMPKAWTDYVDDPDPRSIERRAAAEVPLELVYADWPVSDDPAVHVQAMQRLFDAGVTHVFVHAPQRDQRRVIEFYGAQVLPRLQRREVLRGDQLFMPPSESVIELPPPSASR